jgi:GNAT superfamily N-acetyltransferase
MVTSRIIVSASAPTTNGEVKDYSIDVATEGALPACLALLGPVVHPDTLILAARTSDGALAGAAGLLWQSWGRPPGFPAWIHVLPDCRRQGIGRGLAQAVIRVAVGETDGLWAARPLVEGEPQMAFAASVGFEPAGRQLHFEADAHCFLDQVDRIVDLLAARSRIPAGAKLAPLDRDLADSVALLVRSELASSPPEIARMIAASLDSDPATSPVDVARSLVLLVDGRLGGALLSRRQADGVNSRIVCNVVAPELRRGWANAFMLAGTTRNGIADGAQRFQFDCEETNLDTIGLARRCDARRLRTDVLFRYAVASAA